MNITSCILTHSALFDKKVGYVMNITPYILTLRHVDRKVGYAMNITPYIVTRSVLLTARLVM